MSARRNQAEGKNLGGTARYDRARRYGWANQRAYESAERQERADSLARMAASRKEGQAERAQALRRKYRSTTGMNAGTMGRSRF